MNVTISDAIKSDVDAIKTETDKISDIKTQTDTLPDVKTETDKIQSIVDSVGVGIGADATIIEHHFHCYERWMEKAASPSGETNVADEVGSGSGSFQIDAGNNDWGSWLQILGSADTPVIAGNTKFDLHRIQIESAERTQTYFIQIAFGASGDAAVTAGTYGVLPYTPSSNVLDSGPIEMFCKRIAVGTKAWARCKVAGQDTAKLNFFIGLHGYVS